MTAPGPVPDRFVVVPASYVYLLRDAAGATGGAPEVLLQLRRGTGYMDGHWAAAAAGHVERGETAYDAARREAREELDVTGVELTHLTCMHRTRHGLAIDERIDFFFTARVWRGEPRIVEPEKCADLGWWSLERLPEPTVPHEAAVLAMVLDQACGAGAPPGYTTFGFGSPPQQSDQPDRPDRPDRIAADPTTTDAERTPV